MKLTDFFQSQLEAWPLAKENYDKLGKLQFKDFDFGDFFISAVFNPARAVSSFAKTDAESIKKRPCFLCAKNRPPEQEGIDFLGKYQILVNPYPICPVHFTVTANNHEPQVFNPRMDDFLELPARYEGFTALFNGAKAGASAPDHLHFQLVGNDFFRQPIEKPMSPVIVKESITSSDRDEIKQWFTDVFARKNEELCNIFCKYRNGDWTIVVFPRIKHRPSYFFSGEILSSPGAIDMTGNLVIARAEDFEKIDKDIIADIYKQVSGY